MIINIKYKIKFLNINFKLINKNNINKINQINLIYKDIMNIQNNTITNLINIKIMNI